MLKRFCATVLVLFLAVCPGLGAQEVGSSEGTLGGLVEELRRMNDSLEAIRELLGQQVETQDLDLLFKRSEFSASRKLEVTKELRTAKNELRSIEREDSQMRQSIEIFERQLSAGDFEETDEDMAIYLETIAESLEVNEDRIRESEAHIGVLEGELISRERELQQWQDLLDQRLTESNLSPR